MINPNLKELYLNELKNEVLPFWMKHSLDHSVGGYYTCLGRHGEVYDTDKFIWLQARQVWLFAYMYEHLEANDTYIEIAELGASFLAKYGHSDTYDWFFSLTREGNPLVQPYNIFSNTFATLAFGQLGKVTKNNDYLDLSLKTYKRIQERMNNPKGIYNKLYPNTRDLKNFALPMIMCNLTHELSFILPTNNAQSFTDELIKSIFSEFYHEEYDVILENVYEDGSFSDSFEGRLVNPGHVLEAMWFIMDIAHDKGDDALIEKSVKLILRMIDYGWDEKYGGIFYFKDILEKPMQQLEWDQKLWWVHLEALVALIKAYEYTGNKDCLDWFYKVHDYTWSHFRDPDFGGEWYGYLNREGKVLIPLKGGKWKGCFHTPRALFQIQRSLSNCR